MTAAMVMVVTRPSRAGRPYAAAGRSYRFYVATLAATALAALTPSFAAAQSVDTSGWACEFCPFEQGYRADYSVGASAVSDDSAYFDDATGLGEEGGYVNADGYGAYTGEALRWDWSLKDAGLDSRAVTSGLGKQGQFDLRLSYRELPQREFFTTRSIFPETGNSTLTLPAGWVRAGSSNAFTALAASLADRDIESERSTLALGGRYLGFGRLSFSADYRRRERDGTDILGGSYFSVASLLPVPFEYVTDEVDLGVRYSGDSGYVSLAWYLSDFDSDGRAFTWESPFTTAAGAGTAALAQPPDNRFRQLRLAGGYRFDRLDGYLNVSASLGRAEQDDALLAYTTNPNLTPAALPRASLDGEVDTARYAVSLGARPLKKGRVRLSYRYEERDNQTPVETWERVITDTFVSGDAETNIPYSYERSVVDVDGSYDLLPAVRLAAGFEYREIDRDFQEVREQDETTGWGELRWRPDARLSVTARGGTARRDVERYDEATALAFGQNPLLRKYNLAYRYREFGELALDASLAGGRLGLAVTARLSDDSYSESRLGLISGDEQSYTADLNWPLSERAQVYLHTGFERIESEQRGSEAFAEPDWRANNEDEFVTFGGGFRVRGIAGKVDLQLDVSRADGTAEIAVDSAGAGPARFPDLTTTLDYVDVRATWAYSERLNLGAGVRYQRFEADDWALAGVNEATVPALLTLGADPYDDEVVVVGVSFRYASGGDSGE